LLYFLSNISAEKYHNQLMYVKVIARLSSDIFSKKNTVLGIIGNKIMHVYWNRFQQQTANNVYNA